MPIIEAHLLEGYSASDKQRLARGLTDAACMVIPATPEAVTVMIHEMPAANYMRGGQARSGARPAPTPATPSAPIWPQWRHATSTPRGPCWRRAL